MSSLRLAVIADIHHGRDNDTKLGSQAKALFQPFARMVAEERPDLVIDLGDRINDVKDAATDLANEREVASWFAALPAPRRHLLGNHDVNTLAIADNEAALGTSLASSSMDLKGFHLVFWNCEVRRPAGEFRFGETDLDWLERDLSAATLPTIVFTHVPLDEGTMLGNYYFESRPSGRAFHVGAAAARAIVGASGRVVLCVSGHTHWQVHNSLDGVHYVTLHSLTESFTSHPHASGAHALLEVGPEGIAIDVRGREPTRYGLPMRAVGHSWLRRPQGA